MLKQDWQRFGARLATVVAAVSAATALTAAPASARNVYVTNLGGPVAVLDSITGAPVRPALAAQQSPTRVAVSPDANRVYVTNNSSDTLTAFTLPAFTNVNYRLDDQNGAHAVAVTPDGSRVYFTNRFDDSVSVFDALANRPVGVPIPVGDLPQGLAITPDGTRVYVANRISDTLSVIDTATNTVVTTIPVPAGVEKGIAITPDGKTLLVAGTIGINYAISFLDVATNTFSGSPMTLPATAEEIALNPAGSIAFATLYGPDQLLLIDVATRTVRGTPIPVGNGPTGVAVANTAAGQRAYVTNSTDDTMSIVDVGSASVVTTVPTGGDLPEGVAVAPNQGPIANLALQIDPATRTVTFNGSGSADSDGAVSNYSFNYGDDAGDSGTEAARTHTFAAPGVYTASLRVFDNEGCSVGDGFTGQTAACNTAGKGVTSTQVDLQPPVLSVTAKKRQPPRPRLTVKATADEAVTLAISGKVRVRRPPAAGGRRQMAPLKPVRVPPSTADLEVAGATEPVKVKLPTRVRRLFKAGAAGGVARLSVTASDATGNQQTVQQVVRLKPRKR